MHQIRYFVALSDTLNFTRAAERCNVTQPALTRAIQALEAELGGELLRRERALTHLTDLGERMLPLLRQSFESAIAAKSLATAVRKGEVAPLAIAISRTVDAALVAPALRELARAFPGVRLKLLRGSGPEVAEHLKSGEVDLAIAGPLGEAWDRLDCFSLFAEPFELFVGRDHRLARSDAAEFGDLRGERFLRQADCEMASDLLKVLTANGIADAVAHEVATESDLIVLLETGLGIAIIPASVGHSHSLCCVPLNGLDLTRTVAAYCAAGRRRDAVCATLLNLLRAAEWPQFEAGQPLPGAA